MKTYTEIEEKKKNIIKNMIVWIKMMKRQKKIELF